MNILPESQLLTDDMLQKLVRWPQGLTVAEIRECLHRAERLIDYDDTITVWKDGHLELRQTFCGVSIVDFLAAKPFAIQTWHVGDFPVQLFIRNLREGMTRSTLEHYRYMLEGPQLPEPVIIFTPPGIWARMSPGVPVHVDDCHGRRNYKDFHALGIRSGVEIYDDEPWCIHAPGCAVISDF